MQLNQHESRTTNYSFRKGDYNKRLLSFPKKLVFSAWSNPDHLKEWWGPEGFTNTFSEFDFRPGGKWKFVMHGPEKGNYPNEVEFLGIEEPDYIYWKRHSKPLFEVAVTFRQVADERTEVIFRMIFDNAEESDKLRKFVEGKNEENFDRLENQLALMLKQYY